MKIGRILHLKSEIRDLQLDSPHAHHKPTQVNERLVQLEISDFGFEVQDSSNFKISPARIPAGNCALAGKQR